MSRLRRTLDLTLVQRDGWWYRADLLTQDWAMIRSVYMDDEYGLDDNPPTRRHENIVDVGACIGAFSRKAHQRNPSARIFAVEAHSQNVLAAQRNCGMFASVIHAAMTYEPPGTVGLLDSIYDGTESSGGAVVKPRSEVERYQGDEYLPDLNPLPTITLDDLVEENHLDYIDQLKLDCEGSEFSILKHARCLDRVGLIVGEYHGGRRAFENLLDRRFPPHRWWRRLSNPHDHMGNFWLASRDPPAFSS